MARIFAIIASLKEREYLNCTSLAKRFQVSEKTVQRDIDFMRDRLHMPLKYCPLRYGWYLAEPTDIDTTTTDRLGSLSSTL